MPVRAIKPNPNWSNYCVATLRDYKKNWPWGPWLQQRRSQPQTGAQTRVYSSPPACDFQPLTAGREPQRCDVGKISANDEDDDIDPADRHTCQIFIFAFERLDDVVTVVDRRPLSVDLGGVVTTVALRRL